MANLGFSLTASAQRVFERFSDSFERRPILLSTPFILPFLSLLLVKASRMPMWLDEFYTFWIAGQPSISSSISAVLEGCDNAPPLYAIIVGVLQHVIGKTELALRLPSFLGFCLMLGCAFAFLRRRLGALYAALGVLMAASSTYAFATEGRAYGLALGSIALALFCWQAAADGRSRYLASAGLFVSMAVAISLHYYAVFVLVPLGFAELIRQFSQQKSDLPVTLALILCPLALVPHFPLIQAGRVYVQHFWQKGSLADIPAFYRNAFSDATLWVPLAILMLALYLVISGGADMQEEDAHPGFRPYELVSAMGIALLPVIGIPAARMAIGVARGEYFFPALLGLAMIVPAVLFRVECGRLLVPLALTVALAGWLGTHALYQAAGARRLRNAAALEQSLVGIPAQPAPIFVPSPFAFVELWYYGNSDIRRRVMSAASVKLELLAGHDTVSLMWLAIIRRVSVPVLDLDSFLRATPRFLLADDPSNNWSWFFVRAGYHVEPLNRTGIYLVEAPAFAPRR